MNITEAKKRCDALEIQIDIIRKKYFDEGYARYVGKEKVNDKKVL